MGAAGEEDLGPLLEPDVNDKAEGEHTTLFLHPRYLPPASQYRVDTGSFRGNSGDNVSRGSGSSPHQYTMYVYLSTDGYVVTALVVCFLLSAFGCLWWSYCKNKLRTSPAAERHGERCQQQQYNDRSAPDCFTSYSVDNNPDSGQCDDKRERGIVWQSAEIRTLRPGDDNIEMERGGKSTNTVPEEVDRKVQAMLCENPERKVPTRVSPDDCFDDHTKVGYHRQGVEGKDAAPTTAADRNKDAAQTTADDRNKDTGLGSGRQNDDSDDDDSKANQLEFDDDSYAAQRLQSVEDNADEELKETSPLMEEVDNFSEYLANFSLPFTPCSVAVDGNEGSNSRTSHLRGSGREGGEDFSTTDESFTFAHQVKAHPECSPYHLAWFTPLPRSKLGISCTTSTRKRSQVQEAELQLPFTPKRRLEAGAEDVFDRTVSTPPADPFPKRQQTCEENFRIPQTADSRVDERDSGMSSIVGSQVEGEIGQAYSGVSSLPSPGDDDARKMRKWLGDPPVFANVHPPKLCVCQPAVLSRLSKSCIPEEGHSPDVSSTPRSTSGDDFASLLRARLGCRTPRSSAPCRVKSRSVRIASARSRPHLTFLHPKGKASLSEGCLADKPLCTSSAKNLVELAVISPTEDWNEKAAPEAIRRKGSAIMDDSLLWDSFPFRSASESLIWDHDLTVSTNTEAAVKKGECF